MRVAPRLRAFLALAAGLLALETGLVPRLPQEPQTPQFQDEVSVGLVLVPVVVRSGAGYAKSLDQKDFQLRIEGKTVPIESFERRSDAPASVILLQDLSGSMASGGKLAQSQQALRFFLDKSLPGDEFSIATFAGGIFEVEVPFTKNQAALREASERWEAYGTTTLHDAVARMPADLARGAQPEAVRPADHRRRRQRQPPDPRAGAGGRPARPSSPPTCWGWARATPTSCPEGKKIYRYADVLSLLAAVTGGRYYSISNQEDLQKAWRRSSTTSGTNTYWVSRPETER